MQVFIVRPFGSKKVYKTNKEDKIETIEINFDEVEKKLIKPAIRQLKWEGGTTAEVFEAGDIREDMFSQLLLADVVIADITIHNANVFYELGIRHALRNKRTVLIKSGSLAETPFDILGYRYASYKMDDPGAAIPDLVAILRATADADRTDSPVFNVLPRLQAQDPEKYQALPPDFIEEVNIAAKSKQAGKLNLLANEAGNFVWKIPAYRLIGEALFKCKAWESARVVWEEVKDYKPGDADTNQYLATIYHRLAENEMATNPAEGAALLAKSDLSIETLLNDYINLEPKRRAEAFALKARNAKTRWMMSWKQAPESERQEKALASLQLEASFRNYERGFYEYLNHFYSGINALGMLVTMTGLAKNNPNTWEAAYATPEEANQQIAEWNKKFERLSATVQVSIEAVKKRMETEGKNDDWVSVTEADFVCLTSTNPARVKALYAKVADLAGINVDSTIRQLRLYEQLNIKPENVKSALSALPAGGETKQEKEHYLLFTGHMIDQPTRAVPRFPANKEEAVRKQIKEKVEAEKNRINGPIIGISGGACGGDILFHEVCAELGIPSEMYLALPRDQFAAESVSFAGADWTERYYKLIKQVPNPVLSDSKEMPRWLQKKENYGIWERNNMWLLYGALVNGGGNMTLIAVWDGKGGDGPGGTQHMVTTAKEKGAKVIVIDITGV
jgi:hypothetical protein